MPVPARQSRSNPDLYCTKYGLGWSGTDSGALYSAGDSHIFRVSHPQTLRQVSATGSSYPPQYCDDRNVAGVSMVLSVDSMLFSSKQRKISAFE